MRAESTQPVILPAAEAREFEFIFIAPGRGLVGWVKKDLPEGLLTDFTRDPEMFFHDPSVRVLKDGFKTQVIQKNLSDRSGVPRNVIIKRFRYGSFLRRLGFLMLRSPAAGSLKGALLLRKRGFYTPVPVAAFEYRDWKHLGTSYYIAEEVSNSRSLRAVWELVLPKLTSSERLAATRSILGDLARLLYRLHSMGIYHRDLKGSNILVREGEEDRREFVLVDLDGVREKRRLSCSKKVRNLLQVLGKPGTRWTVRDNLFFLKRYAKLFSMSKTNHQRLVRRVFSSSRKLKTRPGSRTK